MGNPYEVLEIKDNASKEEIKKAYIEMVKKYHPDQYTNNPLRDLAEEKLRDVNAAYDYLMKNNSDIPHHSGNSYSEDNYSNNSSNSVIYNEIRRDIQSGNINDAETKLNRITARDAEWNFLMGLIFLKKGWYDNAYNYIVNACNMEPNNFEYRQTLNNLQRNSNNYRQTYNGRNGSNSDICDLCATLWCADTLCECFGGNLCGCC